MRPVYVFDLVSKTISKISYVVSGSANSASTATAQAVS